MKNFQQKLHEGPNPSLQPNDDVITKEEFEFKPLVQFQKPLKLIQRLSGLTSLFAIYQLAYGGLSFSYLPSSFNLASTVMGLLSLILSIFLVIWSTKALKVERDKTLLTQDMIDKALEKISRVLLISMIIRVAASCVMIPMMSSQGNPTSEYLWAYDNTYNTPGYSPGAETLNNLSMPLPFLELFTCMTFMYAAWTCFRYVKNPSQMISNLVSVSNIALMASSLALVFNTLSIERSFENLLVPSLMPQWNVTGLKYAGILAGLMTGFIWLVNSKKWRAPSMLATGLMTALVLSVGVLTVSSYTSANSISEFYQDTTDMNIWNFKMWNVDQKDIEAFGCPAKYLPSERCPDSMLVNRWEQTSADNKRSYCLNIACSDILGSLYSSPFLKMSNWALASVVSSLIVIAGSFYLSMTRFRDTAPRSKKDYGWLGVLIALVIAFTVAVNTYNGISIHEEGLSMEGLFQTEEKQMRNEGYDRWFGGSGVQMDSDLSRKISRMFLLKENRFIRMRLNKDFDKILLTQAGDYSLQYHNLIENLNPYRAEIALARVPLDAKHDAIVGIVWVPPAISPAERETYLRYYAVDEADPNSEKLGFPVYVATDKESLDKDIVLTNVFKYRTVFLEDEYTEVNEQDLIMQRQEMMTTLMAEVPAELNLSPEDCQELAKMMLSKTYKFIVIGLDLENQKAAIEAKGDWTSTYNDFVQNFRVGQAKVGLIYLDVEGESKLVVVIFENDVLAKMIQELHVDTLPDVQMLAEMGIYLYITSDPAELSIDAVMNGISPQGQLEQEMTQLIALPIAKKSYKYIQKMRERFQMNLATTDATPDLGLEIFNLIAEQKYKFLLQRYNADEKKVELVGTGQWNQSDYNTFVKLIKPNEPQVGYIFLELEGEKRLLLLVYAPKPTYSDPQTVFKMFNLPSDPRRLESIGVHVYIAHKEAELHIEYVLQSIFSDDSSLRKLMQQLNLEDYLVQENMNFRMLAIEMQNQTQTNTGNAILDNMVNKKTYKYVIIKQDPTTNGTFIAKSGDWSSNFNNFVQGIDKGQAEVGLFYFKLETIKKLVLVTYVPLNVNKTFEQVLTDFHLPNNRQQLAQRGISLYNTVTKDELQVKKILRSAYTNVPTVMNMVQVLLEDDEENPNGPLTADEVNPIASRLPTGKPGKGPVETEGMEEIIRDKDTVTTKLAANDEDEENPNGPLTAEEVSPIASKRPTGKPGKGPVETEQMDEIIRDKDTVGINLATKAPMEEIIRSKEGANLNLAADDDEENPNGPLTAEEVNPIASKRPTGKPGKGPVETEQMDEIIRDKDTVGINLATKAPMEEIIRNKEGVNMKLAANDDDEENPNGPLTAEEVSPIASKRPTGKPGKGPVETEDMEEIIRDKDTVGLNLATKAPMEEIIRNKGDVSTNFLFGFGKMGLSLSRDIVKPLKSKKVKYIILKQDPQNNGNVYVASNGTWYATFDQFVKEFEPNVPQVGFIYLEIEGEQKLVMVVYSPEGDAKQVVKDFKVTSKDAAKLKKKGIFTFVLNDLANLTVENAMNSVYSQENQPIIKLMQLMELYSDEPEMLYDINIDDYVSDKEDAEMMLLDKKGLKLDRNIIQTIMSKDNKYTILSRDANGVISVSKTGTWHATFDQFVKDFAPTDDQLGFINLEIEQTKQLVMVVYAPNSPDKTDEQIFSDFGASKSIEYLEKHDVSVYFARILGNINLDMILNKVFNVRNPNAVNPVITIAPNISGLNLPVDIADGIQNQKYKYVVLAHDPQKDVTSVDVSGAWGTEYKKFIKDFSGKKDQIAFTYLDIESKPRLVLVIFADSNTPSQILRNFGLPDNEAVLQNAGIQVYVARKKKDLGIFPLLEGIYSQDTFSENQFMFFEVELFDQADLPLGKDIVDALTNKKYKYMICQHDDKTDTITVQSTGNWGTTYKDFLNDFTKKDKQIGFIFLEAEAKEILVMIVFAPKVAGTQTLREFGLPDNNAELNKLGIKPYIAHKKKELEFNKVLEGVYSSGTFEQNNPVVY